MTPHISNYIALKAFFASAIVALGLVYTNYRKERTKAYNETMWQVDYNY